MTAYANLRNVLADAYARDYYGDGDAFDLCDALQDAFTAYEDDVYNKCRTATDFDNALNKIERGIRRAAATASKGNKAFIVDVVSDYLDADFYGLEVVAF